MVHSLLRTLEHHGVPLTAAKAILVIALFVGASLLARVARFCGALHPDTHVEHLRRLAVERARATREWPCR